MNKNLMVVAIVYLTAGYACADAVGTVENITNMIPSTPVVATIGAVVLELIARWFPTKKPVSLFYTVASMTKALGSLFTKVGLLLDSVLQNVKPAQEEPQVQTLEVKNG